MPGQGTDLPVHGEACLSLESAEPTRGSGPVDAVDRPGVEPLGAERHLEPRNLRACGDSPGRRSGDQADESNETSGARQGPGHSTRILQPLGTGAAMRYRRIPLGPQLPCRRKLPHAAGGSLWERDQEGREGMKRRLICVAALAAALAGLAVMAGSMTSSGSARAAYPVPHPTVSDYQFIKATTPTQADCAAVARTCFTPQAIQSAYNVGPLHQAGWNGKGITIAIVDSYGSDTMAHDLHVFNQAFGLQPMCGEEGVTCAPGMPKFSELAINGSPATKPQPGNGTHQEDKSAWALEVA